MVTGLIKPIGSIAKTGDFLTSGCILIGALTTYGTCRSHHLTDFAIIGNVSTESTSTGPGIIVETYSEIDLARVVNFYLP